MTIRYEEGARVSVIEALACFDVEKSKVIVYAVIIVLYLIINKILVKRLDKYTPAEILKNRE